MDVPATRVCSKCSQEKPLDKEHFYVRVANGKEYFRKVCKICESRKTRERQLANQDQYLADRRRRRKERREIELPKRRQHYAENAEHFRAVNRAWKSKNHERILQQEAQRRQKNREKLNRQAREWIRKNPEKRKLAVQKDHEHHRDGYRKRATKYRNQRIEVHRRRDRERWKKLPKVMRQERAQRQRLKRRAREAKVEIIDHFTIEEIAERDHWQCHLCRKKVTRKTWSIDHHFPVSLPGSVHGRQFVSLAHRRCNTIRSNGRLPAQLRLLP